MNKYVFLLAVFCCSACATLDLPNHHWSELEPYVVTVHPAAGYALTQAKPIRLEFSQPLLAESLADNSIFMISKSSFESEKSDWQNMAAAVAEATIESLPIAITLDDTHQILDVTVDVSKAESKQYVLVVTPDTLSEQRAPLNQTHVSGSDRYFVASYTLTLDSVSTALSDASVVGTRSEGDASEDLSEGGGVSNPDEVGQSSSAPSHSTGPDDLAEAGATDPIFKIDSLIISEIVTDPQVDFSDSSGGNGVPFDSFVGNGSVSSTDEYIELFNGGEVPLNLIGYHLEMLDGTDADQIVSAETWADVNFSGESDFSMFMPGDFVVLGNPEGAINNVMTINLWDDEDGLVDSLVIEDANADDIFTEAYSLDFATGLWEQTLATPGY